MNLKILNIDCEKILRNMKSNREIIQSRIIKEEHFRNKAYYVFSAFVDSNSDSYGVEDADGSITSLSESLEKDKRRLLKCRFIIIDTRKKFVYYDGNLDDIKEILEELFDVKHNKILTSVDIEEFQKLKKLKIRTIKSGQMSTKDLDERYDCQNEFFDEIVENTGEIESTTYEIILKRDGALFNKNRFMEIIRDCQSDLRTITADGFDKDGNEIRLNSQISKKVTILENDSSWSKRIKLDLKQVLDALLEA